MRITRLFKRRREPDGIEQRSKLPAFYGEIMGGLNLLARYGSTVDAGVNVTPETAMQAAAVNSCVSRISRDLATLPRRIIDRGTQSRAANHPMNRLLNSPNAYMTGAEFWKAFIVNLLLYGNGYAAITRSPATNQPIELLPLMSSRTQPRRIGGTLVYVTGYAAQSTLEAGRMAHVPLLSLDGVCGTSPIRTAPGSIGIGMALDQFAARYFSQGGMMNQNAFELPSMSAEALTETRRLLQDEYGGVANSHKIMAAPGLKVHRLTFSMKESQAIEARDWQLREVCRLYNVPVGIIDPEKSTYGNLENQYRDYSQATLRPLAVQIEEEFTRKLLAEDEQDRYAMKFNLDAIVRASLTDRMDADAKGVQAGILTPNEARAHHDLPPVQGGDRLLSPLNMTPADKRSGKLGHDPVLSDMAQSIAQSIAYRESKAAPSAADKPGGLEQWAKDHAAHLIDRMPFLTGNQARAIAVEARDAFAQAHEAGTMEATAQAWTNKRPEAIAAVILEGQTDNNATLPAPIRG